MGKLRKPITFSSHYDIDPNKLIKLGILDVTLNADTLLFIDPLLLPTCKHKEISDSGEKNFWKYFDDVLILLKSSQKPGDMSWEQAHKHLIFPEIQGTCLGYGEDPAGSAIGYDLATRLTNTANYIVKLGVNEPRLFLLLPLLEAGFGPDRISDMTTNIIQHDLLKLTEKICIELEVKTNSETVDGIEYELPINSLKKKVEPVILVPTDILRELPIVTNWDEVADASSHNSSLRSRVSTKIANIWEASTRKDKDKLKNAILQNKESVELMLEVLNSTRKQAYDLNNDPLGILKWQDIIGEINSKLMLTLTKPIILDADTLLQLVKSLVEEFKQLIEKRGCWKLLWHKTDHVNESYAKKLFFMTALSACDKNNIDVSPEADTGPGPVDFKFSQGSNAKVLVEVKLSSNPQIVSGYEKQLESYKDAEKTTRAIYLVIDVGGMGSKFNDLLKKKNEISANRDIVSDIEYIDGNKQVPPSKKK